MISELQQGHLYESNEVDVTSNQYSIRGRVWLNQSLRAE